MREVWTSGTRKQNLGLELFHWLRKESLKRIPFRIRIADAFRQAVVEYEEEILKYTEQLETCIQADAIAQRSSQM